MIDYYLKDKKKKNKQTKNYKQTLHFEVSLIVAPGSNP
jgi:hypothetical protein